ncbi:PPE1 (YHR075C) [Zygosaccharomyces parabailii]|nr:PPE1 (YHR075C) [Zygosaccharomyces parabailii]CDH12544.1 probable protein phosphatase methylesterase 1 [Zygosaccharomyces bailii ISA1307]
MGEDIRRKLVLKQLEQASMLVDNGAEQEDELGELPSMKSHIKNKSMEWKTPLKIESSFLEESLWHNYFDRCEHVRLKDRNLDFNTYYSLPKSVDAPSIPIFILHHGAGSSGLTFATLAKQLMIQLDDKCGCFAFDARGHGNTRPIDPDRGVPYDLQSFNDDFIALLNYFCETILAKLGKTKLSLILVGHSLGGSICTFSYPQMPISLQRKVLGISMLDIVEEAAIVALQNVHTFLSKTPSVFKNYEEAIDWSIRRGMSKNRISAEVAVPACFHQVSSGKVVRITNLKDFEPYWDTWFKELSHEFVSLPISKLLILAGNDNLDKELIIGQMQGKYQLVVFQDSGHFIQEDVPVKTAITLLDFWKRNDSKNIVIKTNWGSNNFEVEK